MDKNFWELWDDLSIFKDEPLRRKEPSQKSLQRLPERLRRARALETKHPRMPRAELFRREAQMLVNYEDNYAFSGNPNRFYPTYDTLTDEELRGYFTWRTKLRREEYENAPLGFVLLYLYEIINGIGIDNYDEGMERLMLIREHYGQNPWLAMYLDDWIAEYAVYYNLDAGIPAEAEAEENNIVVLKDIATRSQEEVTAAISGLGAKWLTRSRFYNSFKADMDAVIYRVLKRMSAHYAKGCKNDLISQFFGTWIRSGIRIFAGAIFSDPLKIENFEYRLSPLQTYRCVDGDWEATRFYREKSASRKFEKLLKTIDGVMREAFGDRHPIRAEIATKWILKVIREEVDAHLAEKKTAEKKPLKRKKIDFSSLEKIREDAAIIRDRLIVEEEAEAEQAAPQKPLPEPQAETEKGSETAPGLAPEERRLLHSLLYGGGLGWIREEGLILSVLVDAVNEKLYDVFGDSVIDETPGIVEDYITDLKEMFPA